MGGDFDARVVVAGAAREVGVVAGASADTVWPLSLVLNQVPFQRAHDPGRDASVIASGRWTSPRSFQTFTRRAVGQAARARVRRVHLERRRPVARRRAAESRGGALVGGGRDQGQREGVSYGRKVGSGAPYLRSEYADSSSTLPLGVFGKTLLEQDRFLAADRHGQRAVGGKFARPEPFMSRVGGVERLVHQLGVAGLEDRIVEPEAGGQPAEDLGVRQGLADGGGSPPPRAGATAGRRPRRGRRTRSAWQAGRITSA